MDTQGKVNLWNSIQRIVIWAAKMLGNLKIFRTNCSQNSRFNFKGKNKANTRTQAHKTKIIKYYYMNHIHFHVPESKNLVQLLHYVKSVQMRSFFWSECEKIRTRKNSVFGQFSRSIDKWDFWKIIQEKKTNKKEYWVSLKRLMIVGQVETSTRSCQSFHRSIRWKIYYQSCAYVPLSNF